MFCEKVENNSRMSTILRDGGSLNQFKTIVRDLFNIDLLSINGHNGIWAAASCDPRLWVKIHRKDEKCPEGWLKDMHVIKLPLLTENEGDRS